MLSSLLQGYGVQGSYPTGNGKLFIKLRMIKFRSKMPTELLWWCIHLLILSLLLAVCHKGLKEHVSLVRGERTIQITGISYTTMAGLVRWERHRLFKYSKPFGRPRIWWWRGNALFSGQCHCLLVRR